MDYIYELYVCYILGVVLLEDLLREVFRNEPF